VILAELAAVVFLCNLMPIMAPPTWSVLVYFVILHNLHVAPVVIVGALAAGFGRLLLAYTTGKVGRFLPQKISDNLLAAGKVFEGQSSKRWGTIVLFVISPLPSAQLFEAAGIMKMNLLRLTFAFFSGRIITYTIYSTGAHTVESTKIGTLFKNAFTSPYAWALQLASLLIIYLLAKIDWKKYLK
jgi:membrane protein YqaA with SNARE-associated domain